MHSGSRSTCFAQAKGRSLQEHGDMASGSHVCPAVLSAQVPSAHNCACNNAYANNKYIFSLSWRKT